MLHASPDCRLDSIHFLDLVAKRMIASTLFVYQTFEASETQEIRNALTCIRSADYGQNHAVINYLFDFSRCPQVHGCIE